LLVSSAFAQTPTPVPPDEQPKDDGPKPVPVNPEDLPPDQRPQEEQKPPPDDAQKPPPGDAQKPPPGDAQKPPPGDAQKPPPGDAQKKPIDIPKPRELEPSKIKDVEIKAQSDVQIEEQVAQTPLTGSEVIKSIGVEDNEKTDTDTVIYISGLEKGDTFSGADAKIAKDKLVSCGLFKSVNVRWKMVPGGVRVILQVQDKHSWIIAPAYYNQPTNQGGGVGFGENNLFGQNQKLLLYGQIATGDSFFIGAWVIPAIANTRWYAQFDTFLKSARNIEYAAPNRYLDITDVGVAGSNPVAIRESRIHYLNGGLKLGIELFRGLKVDGRLRTAKVTFVDEDTKLSDAEKDRQAPVVGTDVDEDPARPGKPIAPGGDGWDTSTEVTMQLDRRANYYGIQTGYKVAVSFERSLEALGSDFDYWLTGVNIYKAKKILDKHNLVGKFFAGYGHNLPFQQEYQTGGTSMRGWLNSQFRGNLKVSGTAEYSLPIFPTIYGLSIRGLVFWDSAYTTFTKDTDDPQREMEAKRNYLPDSDVRGLKAFKNSVGVGTRFYLRQIVLPLLGLDVGYGLEARDVQVYLAIGLTD
jgi:outer membrane protein insertion porin family